MCHLTTLIVIHHRKIQPQSASRRFRGPKSGELLNRARILEFGAMYKIPGAQLQDGFKTAAPVFVPALL
jgi:hypothetical protein